MSGVIVVVNAGEDVGVSYGGSNPEPHHFLPCADRQQAHALAAQINGNPACPLCRKTGMIPPGVDYRAFTCDCGGELPESR